jgi:hypothetical protein
MIMIRRESLVTHGRGGERVLAAGATIVITAFPSQLVETACSLLSFGEDVTTTELDHVAPIVDLGEVFGAAEDY